MRPDGVSSLRLGYILARTDTALPWLPGCTYRGVDRLPSLPNPLKQSDDRTASAWSAYADAAEDGTLCRELRVAERVQERLREIGVNLEVIFAEVVSGPDPPQKSLTDQVYAQRARSLEWLRTRTAGIGAPDRRLQPVGFDVSSPIPGFHSAILQPGLVRKNAFAAKLNEFGLFTSEEIAADVALEANASGYGIALFCVVRVLAR